MMKWRCFIIQPKYTAVNQSYLKYESSGRRKIIYQEFLDESEYGADIINDLTENTSVIVKRKLHVRRNRHFRDG